MKKILLAEDDPFIVDIYTTKLKEAGLNVEVVSEGDEVLAKVRKQKPNLLLLDIVLPTMNGWEILRAIRQSEDLKSLAVVILSNLYQKDEVEKGLKLGALKYMIKAHYTPSEVVQEVKKILASTV
ncbi:MAG: response regulator [Candidatus Nealsonbacteria bacterium]